MAVPTKTWKKVELAIAALIGGKRRGADFRGENHGKSDIICPGWSVEVKHSKRPTFGLMVDAVAQSETNREKPGDIPIAVVHKEGTEYKNSLVVMRLDQFIDFFLDQCEEST
jgi:hypothetical protein